MRTDFIMAPRLVEAGLSAADKFTKPVCIHSDHNVTIWGTFTGTLTLQRSFDYIRVLQGRLDASQAVWHDVSTYTAPVSTTGEPEPEADVYYRLGFKAGATVTGTAMVRLSY